MRILTQTAFWPVAVASLLATNPAGAAAATDTSGDTQETHVVIKAIEPPGSALRKDAPWLGIASEEAPEALSSQLGLDPGVGLVVTYVAPGSPAEKAGLAKNDLLVELEGQTLVLPAQLRKLVQSRKADDTIKLTFFRAGKKQTASAKLTPAADGAGWLDDGAAWQGDLRELQRKLRELPLGDAFREQMKAMRESLGHVQFDQKKVQEEVRRSVEQARKAFQEAMRQATNAHSALRPALKELEALAKSGALSDNQATVTVRSTGQSTKSVVKVDETGTLVIVASPKLRLTAHDPAGKLLFDGEIETADQRAAVPRELWERVEPLLDKLSPKAEEEPPASGKSSSLRTRDVVRPAGSHPGIAAV